MSRYEGARGHRFPRWLRLSSWLLAYLLLAAALVGANPFRGETTGPFDLLTSYGGWQVDGEAVSIRHGARSDILDAMLPKWLESKRQLHAGVPPIWNPLVAGGEAAILNPTNSQLTVGFAAFAAVPDDALGFYLSVVLTLALGGLGMHLLVAGYCGRWAGLFAGISFMACGFITAWLFWPHTHTAIWIPWLLLAVDRHAVRGTPASLAGIALATALMFLGGFPFVVAIGLGAALVHAAVLLARQDARTALRRGAAIAGGIVLGLGLVALPLLTLLAQFDTLDLGYRSGGSIMSLETHRKLLLRPWASATLDVETHMYVGTLAFLLSVLGIATLFRRNRSPLAVSGAILFVVGAFLAFGILPREIGAHLPVLSSNPWNRAILLLDIAIILLASVALGRLLSRIRWPWVAMSAAAAVCLVQALDVGAQFRKFNGPTPADLFYPVSAEVAAVQRAAGPFQYVAQDSGLFLVSGSLGAVGLGEWYGHALRSPELARLLDGMADRPFTSRTATAIRARDFHLSGELADITGLCYALVPPGSIGLQSIAMPPAGGGVVALPPINGLDVVQPFRVKTATSLAAILVRLATYRARDLDGTVSVEVRRAGDPATIARAELPGARILDNVLAAFRFESQPWLEPGDYEFVLRYAAGPRNRNLTAWMFKDAPGTLQRGAETLPGQLIHQVAGPPDGSVEILAEGPRTMAVRNVGCVEGPYWTPDPAHPLRGREGGQVVVQAYAPHRFTLASQAPTAGTVIVPMRYQAGWRATVDGAPAMMRLVEGVLPAVDVPAGRAVVGFRYVPPGFWLGLAVSTLSSLLCLLLLAARRPAR